jgi:hypothetical protein
MTVPASESAGGASRTEYAIVINGELAVVPRQIVSYTEASTAHRTTSWQELSAPP